MTSEELEDVLDNADPDWFSIIANRLRDYSEGDVWSDGIMILCKTHSGCESIADLLTQLYDNQGKQVTIVTGYYDPEEDHKDQCEDRYTGWWYCEMQ